MKSISRLLLLSLPVLMMIAACSDNSTTNPDPNNNNNNNGSDSLVYKDGVVTREYDGPQGGVQITGIYYDQGLNKSMRGEDDEWIVIEATAPRSTSGWKLNAGDPTQDYPLPATINKRLIIYTKKDPSSNTDSTLGLGLNNWIWNNSDPDVARIYNEQGQAVDSMSYRGK